MVLKTLSSSSGDLRYPFLCPSHWNCTLPNHFYSFNKTFFSETTFLRLRHIYVICFSILLVIPLGEFLGPQVSGSAFWSKPLIEASCLLIAEEGLLMLATTAGDV